MFYADEPWEPRAPRRRDPNCCRCATPPGNWEQQLTYARHSAAQQPCGINPWGMTPNYPSNYADYCSDSYSPPYYSVHRWAPKCQQNCRKTVHFGNTPGYYYHGCWYNTGLARAQKKATKKKNAQHQRAHVMLAQRQQSQTVAVAYPSVQEPDPPAQPRLYARNQYPQQSESFAMTPYQQMQQPVSVNCSLGQEQSVPQSQPKLYLMKEPSQMAQQPQIYAVHQHQQVPLYYSMGKGQPGPQFVSREAYARGQQSQPYQQVPLYCSNGQGQSAPLGDTQPQRSIQAAPVTNSFGQRSPAPPLKYLQQPQIYTMNQAHQHPQQSQPVLVNYSKKMPTQQFSIIYSAVQAPTGSVQPGNYQLTEQALPTQLVVGDPQQHQVCVTTGQPQLQPPYQAPGAYDAINASPAAPQNLPLAQIAQRLEIMLAPSVPVTRTHEKLIIDLTKPLPMDPVVEEQLCNVRESMPQDQEKQEAPIRLPDLEQKVTSMQNEVPVTSPIVEDIQPDIKQHPNNMIQDINQITISKNSSAIEAPKLVIKQAHHLKDIKEEPEDLQFNVGQEVSKLEQKAFPMQNKNLAAKPHILKQPPFDGAIKALTQINAPIWKSVDASDATAPKLDTIPEETVNEPIDIPHISASKSEQVPQSQKALSKTTPPSLDSIDRIPRAPAPAKISHSPRFPASLKPEPTEQPKIIKTPSQPTEKSKQIPPLMKDLFITGKPKFKEDHWPALSTGLSAKISPKKKAYLSSYVQKCDENQLNIKLRTFVTELKRIVLGEKNEVVERTDKKYPPNDKEIPLKSNVSKSETKSPNVSEPPQDKKPLDHPKINASLFPQEKKPLISQENNAVKCSLDKKSLTPSQNKVQESKPTFSLQEKKPTNNQKNISNWQQDKKPLIKNQANNSVKLSFDKKPAFALKHKKVINASRKIEQPVGDSMVRKSNMFELLEESESPSTCIEIEEDDVSLPDAKKENVDPRTSVNSKKLKRRIKKRETAQRNLQLAKERAAKDAARAKKSREKAKALRAATLKSDDESLRLWTPKSDEEELEYWSALSPHLRLKPHEQQPEATKSDDLTEDNQFKKPNSKIIKQCRNSIKPTPKEVANEPSKTIANDVKNSQILQEENHKLKELEPETDASAESLQLQFPGSNLESPQSTEQHTISPRSRKNSRLGQLVLAVNLGALKRPNEGRHTSHRTIESRKWEIYYRKLPSTLRCSPNLQLRTTIIYVQEKGTETVVELLKRIKSNPLRIKPDLRDCKLNRMLDKTNSDCQALDSGGGNCDPEANKLGKLTNFLPFGFEATRYRAPIVFRLPVSQGSGVRFGTAFPLPIRMPGAVAPPSPPTAPIQIGEPFPSAPRGRRGRDQKLWNKRKVYQKRYCPFRRPHVDEVGSSDTE